MTRGCVPHSCARTCRPMSTDGSGLWEKDRNRNQSRRDRAFPLKVGGRCRCHRYRYRTCAFVCVVVSIDVDARFGSVSRAREANWANRADSNRMNATLSVSSHIIIRTALVCVYMSCRSVEQSGVVEAVRSVLS